MFPYRAAHLISSMIRKASVDANTYQTGPLKSGVRSGTSLVELGRCTTSGEENYDPKIAGRGAIAIAAPGNPCFCILHAVP